MIEFDDTLPLVPFCPWRCPRCADGKPYTYGRRGRIRYHRCKSCDTRYRSMMLDAKEAPTWGEGGQELRALRVVQERLEAFARKVPHTPDADRAWSELWDQVEAVRRVRGQQR